MLGEEKYLKATRHFKQWLGKKPVNGFTLEMHLNGGGADRKYAAGEGYEPVPA